MVEGYKQCNVFINMTCVSLTPSSDDNQRIIMEKGGSNQLNHSSVDRTVLTSQDIRMHFPSELTRG